MSSTSIHFPVYGTPYSPHHVDTTHGEGMVAQDDVFTCVIRTDACMATEVLQQNIIEALGDARRDIGKLVTRSYANWGKSVVELIATHLDFESGHYTSSEVPRLQAHFFKSAKVSRAVVDNALSLLSPQDRASGHYLFITLDDMIRPSSVNIQELAFSRQFTMDGTEELGYVARPGYPDISSQIKNIKNNVEFLESRQGGRPVPLVFLEDNIRRAKMMNWVIDQLADAGVFEHAYLDGISTCFCSADRQELKKIRANGKPVNVTAVAHYSNGSSDVITPRDLFFDGYVVEKDGYVGRLPAIFMDVSARFKIHPSLQDTFKSSVALANIIFCMDMKSKLGIDIPLKWMENGEIISRVTGKSPETRVVDVMRDFLLPSDRVKQPVITSDRYMVCV